MILSPFKCYATGSTFLIIIGVCHLIGHFLPITLENSTEIELMTLMKTYPKRIAGGSMTVLDIQNGLSLFYALFMMFAGVANFVIFKKDPVDWRLLKRLSLLNVITFAVGSIIALRYFFWLPVMSCLMVCFAFLLARLNFEESF